MRILYYFPLPGKCRKGYSSIHYEMLHASTMNQTNRESLPFPWGNIHMQLHCNSSFDEFPMQLLYRSPACNPRHKPDVHCHKHPGTVAPHPLVDPALDLLRNVHVETWINKPFMRALIKVSVRSDTWHIRRDFEKGFGLQQVKHLKLKHISINKCLNVRNAIICGGRGFSQQSENPKQK